MIGINPSNENQIYFLAAETDGHGQHTDVFFGGETWTSLWKYEYISGDGTGLGGKWTDLSSNIPTNQATSFDNFKAKEQSKKILYVQYIEKPIEDIFLKKNGLLRHTDERNK